MKHIPIIRSTQEVQGLLGRRVTQICVPIKPQPPSHIEHIKVLGNKIVACYPNMKATMPFDYSTKLPFAPHDLIYVREAWFPAAIMGNTVLIAYHDKSSDTAIEIKVDDIGKYNKLMRLGRMLSPATMPKEAARIWLSVTKVWVERLQDITEEGAKAEGGFIVWCAYVDDEYGQGYGSYLESYKKLKSGLWQSNPWVFRATVEVVSKKGKPNL